YGGGEVVGVPLRDKPTQSLRGTPTTSPLRDDEPAGAREATASFCRGAVRQANQARPAAIASQAPSSANFTPACVSGHSLADTRSITSVTTPSHTPAHTSAPPAFTEPSAFPCAIRLSRPRRQSREVLRLS